MNNMNFVMQLDQLASESFKDVEGFKGPGWYYWDVTETFLFGPYTTSEDAQISYSIYHCKYV